MNWIIIVALIALVFVFFSFKMNNFRTKVAFIFIFLGVSFLLVTAYYVSIGDQPDVSKLGNAMKTGKIYANWLFGALSNFLKITSYTIKESLGNSTVISNLTKWKSGYS